MKWLFTRNGEAYSIPPMNRIIGTHDVDGFHPEEEDGSVFCMANGCEVTISTVDRRIRLLMN